MIGLKVTDAGTIGDPSGLYSLLCAIREHVLPRDWLISDAELWIIPTADRQFHAMAEDARKGHVWMTGANLLRFAQTVTVANWGAILGFACEMRPELKSVPISECGYSPIQHPDADIEIQAVDGEFFEVYCGEESLYQSIRNVFSTEEVDSSALFD